MIFGTKRVSLNLEITHFETHFSTKIPNWVQNFLKSPFLASFLGIHKKFWGILTNASEKFSKTFQKTILNWGIHTFGTVYKPYYFSN